jgi:hypothetical protein
MTIKHWVAAGLAACVLSVQPEMPALAQQQSAPAPVQLADLLAANSYPISVTAGKLSGPGRDFLLRATRDAQFVAIGEQHNSAQIPEFTTALLNELHRAYRFDHLALEQDPVGMHLASSRGMAGRRAAVERFATQHPFAFTFVGDQEVDMIADAGALPDRHGDAVWGLDQVFGVRDVLEQLLPYAPDAAARARTRTLIDDAARQEAQRTEPLHHYIYVDIPKPPDFDRLAEIYRPKPDSYPAFLIDQLNRSVAIYRDNDLAGKGQFTGYRSNAEREENMKLLFMHGYRSAQALGEAKPRVVVKMGNVHLARGRNQLSILTLGNFLSEFAKSNGMSSFHLAAYINNDKPGSYTVLRDDPTIGPLFRNASPDQWIIYDLRPLRGPAYAGRLAGITPDLARLIFAYDAALLIGNGTHATKRLVPGG